MAGLQLLYRLVLRPLAREPVRTALTAFAVALGVSVVVAIDLASRAATGSFQSSLESLAGDADLEITSVGGLDETLLADLAGLPHPIRFSPRVEGFARLESSKETVPVLGLDLIGDASLEPVITDESSGAEVLNDPNSIWVSPGVDAAVGGELRLTINDQTAEYVVRGILESKGLGDSAREKLVVMDIYGGQDAMGKSGRLDRIDVRLPEDMELGDAEATLRQSLPDGVEVRAKGARTRENQRMLSAFKWNLRVLSYISLVVGAFFIYNTISVSVVRRRTEIGMMRALGATRRSVLLGFLCEAALFGAVGTLLGLLLGRLMANGAVELMGSTVEQLYLSSSPGEIRFSAEGLLVAVAAGVGVAILAALAPAREAARVPPTEAMARGRHEYQARERTGGNLAYALVFAAAAGAACLAPPVREIPLFGYFAALLLVAAAAFATPSAVQAITGAVTGAARRALGVEGLLAARSLAGSLSRTSVIVAALATAVAMMASVGIMVGSYRETVTVWMDHQLRADLYVRPAIDPAIDRHPTLSLDLAKILESLPEIEAIDRFRAYEITYNGRPATLGAGETDVFARRATVRFLEGGGHQEVVPKLSAGRNIIVSEAFANKHGLGPGDTIALPLFGAKVDFQIVGVFYDYSTERGYLIANRDVLLEYLPDPSPTNLALYVAPGVKLEDARNAVERAVAGHQVFLASNRSLRQQALRIFDRTFAITYALEVVAIVVAILGMAGALLALVIDRRREIGVLRFLGASAQQIRKLILFESGLLGLLANLLGVGLGTLLSLVLIYVINKQSFGWTIQFHWPVGLFLGALSLVYVSAVAAGVYPARIATRLNPIEVLHEE